MFAVSGITEAATVDNIVLEKKCAHKTLEYRKKKSQYSNGHPTREKI